MFILLKPNLVRRFSHTHSKTNFPENKKIIEDLIKEQNETLDEIRKEISTVGIILSLMTATIAFKPMK